MLLLIPGGGAAGDIFAPVVGPLAQHSTAVRYDPRGISRSRIDGPAEDVPIDVHDAALALAERLATPPVTFPGGHAGDVTHPALFAAKLDEVLRTS